MTGQSEWGLVKGPDGGIVGVYSPSEKRPVKTANFSTADAAFEGKASYAEWKFIYVPEQARGTNTIPPPSSPPPQTDVPPAQTDIPPPQTQPR